MGTAFYAHVAIMSALWRECPPAPEYGTLCVALFRQGWDGVRLGRISRPNCRSRAKLDRYWLGLTRFRHCGPTSTVLVRMLADIGPYSPVLQAILTNVGPSWTSGRNRGMLDDANQSCPNSGEFGAILRFQRCVQQATMSRLRSHIQTSNLGDTVLHLAQSMALQQCLSSDHASTSRRPQCWRTPPSRECALPGGECHTQKREVDVQLRHTSVAGSRETQEWL